MKIRVGRGRRSAGMPGIPMIVGSLTLKISDNRVMQFPFDPLSALNDNGKVCSVESS
jgi:hypothetical protein